MLPSAMAGIAVLLRCGGRFLLGGIAVVLRLCSRLRLIVRRRGLLAVLLRVLRRYGQSLKRSYSSEEFISKTAPK